MFEATKTKQIWNTDEKSYINGEGLDIGCGPDPISETVTRFDINDGDANEICKYINRSFDYVFSAHCLEHMNDPCKTIVDWWRLVRRGGILIIIVPDEDLYEQGYWPSIFNKDHKWSFTISKRRSWNLKSINMIDLHQLLPEGKLLSLELQNNNYDMRLLSHSAHTRNVAVTLRKVASFLDRYIIFNPIKMTIIKHLNIPIDQTCFGALAQIQLIIRKYI